MTAAPIAHAQTEHELLAAIGRNPESRASTDAYVDWLNTAGRTDRAEFVRLSFERERALTKHQVIGDLDPSHKPSATYAAACQQRCASAI